METNTKDQKAERKCYYCDEPVPESILRSGLCGPCLRFKYLGE